MTGQQPAGTPADSSDFLLGRDVCQLLNIGSSTLQPWRDAGLLEFHKLPNGQYRYPKAQRAIRDALEALSRYRAVRQ